MFFKNKKCVFGCFLWFLLQILGRVREPALASDARHRTLRWRLLWCFRSGAESHGSSPVAQIARGTGLGFLWGFAVVCVFCLRGWEGCVWFFVFLGGSLGLVNSGCRKH